MRQFSFPAEQLYSGSHLALLTSPRHAQMYYETAATDLLIAWLLRRHHSPPPRRRRILGSDRNAMQLHLQLPHSFEVEWLRELPSDQPPIHYHPAHSTSGGKDGLLLRFQPHSGPAWIGCFAFGSEAPNAPTTVVSSPDPSIAFVVAKGAGYSVHPDTPETCERLPVFPILFVEVVPDQRMVIFGGQTALAVYGPQGLSWFKRVVPDELKLQRVSDSSIHFTGWNAVEEKTVEGCVDITSGERCR